MRKTYIDNIRWITVVLVVIYHVIYMFNGIQTAGVIGPFWEVQYQDAYQYMVYPWFMVLLFVISGMSARYYFNSHTHKDFIKSRTRKLLVPSTIGLFVFQWILGYYNVAISGALDSMGNAPAPIRYLIMCLSGTGVLWYIQLLWILSLVLVLVRKIERDRFYRICAKTNIWLLLLLTVAIWGAAQILNTPVIVVYRFGIYGLAFFIGYFCLSHDEVVERLSRWWHLLTVGAVGLGVAFLVVYWQEPYAEHVVLDTPLCNAFAWIACLAIIAFMSRWGSFSNSFTRFMNRESWGLYVFHYLPLAASAWYLRTYAPQVPVPVVYLIVAIAAFGGAFLLNEIISRIPVIRWCVLGIGKKKKQKNQEKKVK